MCASAVYAERSAKAAAAQTAGLSRLNQAEIGALPLAIGPSRAEAILSVCT